jgi:1,3-beta-galactosyl-N-acetylhexosamine phosphorylase
MAANSFGKGRSLYMAGLPYSLENSRLLHRSLFWVSNKENKLKRWFSSNLNTDCAAYPDIGMFVVVNNIRTEQKTIVYDGRGTPLEVVSKPSESKWFTI